MAQEAVNNHDKKPKKIVVAGDVTIDWLESQVKSDGTCSGETANWKLYTKVNMTVRKGGALLSARMVEYATDIKPISHKLK